VSTPPLPERTPEDEVVVGGDATGKGIEGRPHRDRIWLTIGMRIVKTTPKII
jgi:hypothetical protein